MGVLFSRICTLIVLVFLLVFILGIGNQLLILLLNGSTVPLLVGIAVVLTVVAFIVDRLIKTRKDFFENDNLP